MVAVDGERDELADRVRALLGVAPGIEERRMFGTRAFLIDGHILVGARRGGALLVRVAEENGATLVLRPGVSQALMGSKTMGLGWLDVDASALRDDDDLVFWLDVAREDAGGES